MKPKTQTEEMDARTASIEEYMKKQFAQQLQEAEAGDRLAMFLVAMSYQTGSGVAKDGAKAVEWHTKAEDWSALAQMYQTGDGVAQDFEKAAMYYEKALKSGVRDVNGEDLPSIIRKLKMGEDGLPKKKAPCLSTEEMYMDGEALCQKAELARTCDDHKKELLLYKRAAELGHIPAYTKLGMLYAEGFYFPSDYKESSRWLKRGMEAGDPEAFYEMSEACRYSSGRECDEQKVTDLLEKAAALGYPRAMYRLGNNYRGRGNVAKDIQKAIYWLEKAAVMVGTEPEDAPINYASSSMYILGNIYAEGKDVPQDIEKAIAWYEKAWMAGEKGAWKTIAEIYHKGKGSVEKDKGKMLEIYKRAAEMGESDAIYKLGLFYEKGILVEKDERKAYFMYLKAAELRNLAARERLAQICAQKKFPLQRGYWERRANAVKAASFFNGPVKLHRGIFDEFLSKFKMGALARDHYKAEEMDDASAMFWLGYSYMNGENGAKQDEKKAVDWYRKAVEAGKTSAMNNLAVCYEHGVGVEKNMEKAVALYREAAEYGEGASMYHLGDIAAHGTLGETNKAKSLDWYKKAVDVREPRAMVALGNAYENGSGVSKDRNKALELYREAARTGLYDGILALAQFCHGGRDNELAAIREKAKALVEMTKDIKRRAIYADIEDFLLDQYGDFLMANTKDSMTDRDLSAFWEKDRTLLQEMMDELEIYMKAECNGIMIEHRAP